MQETYRIPEPNLEALRARIERLNRRAARLGVEPISMRETGQEFDLLARTMLEDPPTTFRIDLSEGETIAEAEQRTRALYPHRPLKFEPRRYVWIEVTGVAPKIAGWSFAAVIQHLEGGNLLVHVPGWEQAVPAEYRNAEPACDHCRTSRDRKDTYLVCSDDGTWKQVGRQCLRDFTGHQDPHAIAEWAEMLAGLARDCRAAENEWQDSGHELPWLSLSSYLPTVAWCIRRYGWVSRRQAKESPVPLEATADLALRVMRPSRDSQADRELVREWANDTGHDQDDRVAHEAIEWAQGLEPKVEDDYLWNLRVIAHSEVIELRQTGLAASMIAAHARATERELERRRRAEAAQGSRWIGEVGARLELDVTMVSTKFFDNDFGGTELIVFVDDAGNRIKWWASARGSWAPAIGGRYHVRATVKAHEERNGVRETVVTRVQEFDPEAAARAKAASREAARQRAKERRADTAAMPSQDDPRLVARYEAIGEPDGCYHCGSQLHHSSDCREEM